MARSLCWAFFAGLVWTSGFLIVAIAPEFLKTVAQHPTKGLAANVYHAFIDIGLYAALMAAVLIDLGIETLILPRSKKESRIDGGNLVKHEFHRDSGVGTLRFMLVIVLLAVTVGLFVATVVGPWKDVLYLFVGAQIFVAFVVKSMYYAKPPAQVAEFI